MALATVGYLGPTLIAEEGNPVTIQWQNQLPLTGHILPVDDTLHRASPTLKTLGKGYVPIVTHLESRRASRRPGCISGTAIY